MKRYQYSLHFTHGSIVHFKSELAPTEFLEQFNNGPVEDIDGYLFWLVNSKSLEYMRSRDFAEETE